jgi:hypothetical protein
MRNGAAVSDESAYEAAEKRMAAAPLGHLKLMMEVEQAPRVRLPADALSRIQSYKDLEKAVRANLPAK